MGPWRATLTLDGADERLLAVDHEEALGAVPRSRCVVALDADPPALASLLGKDASVTLGDGDAERVLPGVVVAAALEPGVPRAGHPTHRLELEIAPRLHRLALRSDCRTFQKTKIEDVAKKVLEGAGYGGSEIEISLDDPPPERTYVAQYRETDLAFLERVLAEEGIHLAVVEKGGKDAVVLFDADRGPADPAELPASLAHGLAPAAHAATGLRRRSEIRSGKVVLREYDFKKPRLGLEVEVEAEGDAELERFDPPGRYVEESAGKRLAQIRLDALRTARNRTEGVTTTLGLRLGQLVEITGHPYDAMNGELFVTRQRLRYEEAGATARVEFEGHPTKDGPARPAPVSAARTSPGLQSAFVTGPSGKEISATEHGEVTVWWPWDRVGKKDETASLPLRAVQMPFGGSQLTPRVGWEVSVGFYEGDVDRPLVQGRMTNAATPPAYPLPGGKTKSSIQTATTPGGGSTNEIRFDDAKGSEELFMNASGKTNVSVGNDATDGVTADETRTISGNQTISVAAGFTAKVDGSQVLLVGGSQSVAAATKGVDDAGSHSLLIGGSRSLTIGGDYKKTASGASTLSVGGSSVDLVMGSHDTKAKASLKESVSAANVILTSKMSVHAVGARSEKAGAAKVILAAGSRVTTAASLTHKVAGAIGALVRGDREEKSGGGFTEVAGGAQIIKASNVTIEASDLLSIVMGGSTITLSGGVVAIAGVSITFDGPISQPGPVLDLA